MKPVTGLHKGEKIIDILAPSPWIYLSWYIIGLILTPFIIGILILVLAELSRRANKYFITNKRIIHEYSFFSRKISSTFYEKIQDIHLKQGFGERIFNIGSLYINTAGSSSFEIKIKGIPNPVTAKRTFEEYIVEKHNKK